MHTHTAHTISREQAATEPVRDDGIAPSDCPHNDAPMQQGVPDLPIVVVSSGGDVGPTTCASSGPGMYADWCVVGAWCPDSARTAGSRTHDDATLIDRCT